MSGKKTTVGAGALLGLLGGALAHANPQGGVVASGQATFSHPAPGTLNVTNSNGAIINWPSFSIGAQETTRFIQPSTASAVLNRVVGRDPSEILGQLLSNGRVYLINPNGIVFGPGSRVDTAGLIASTLNMSDEDFKAGRLKFQGGPDAGAIKNQGYIKAGPGGEVVLIAPRIENSGIVETPDGKLILAAGQSVNLASLDFDDIVFEVQAPENEVVNLGQLIAERGTIGVFAGGIRNAGTISADSATVDAQGRVVLAAKSDIHLESTSTITANGPAGGDIRVESQEGTAWVAGNVEATGSEGSGGSVQLLGERVAVQGGASVDVSGEAGGGEILVGGDYQGKNPDIHNAKQTYVSSSATLKADALTNGNGGKVIVWGDETTQAYGEISARGGAEGGDGGFIETSGHWLDVAGSKIDASAPKGRGGTWLLDPYNLTVVNSVSTPATESPTGIWSSGAGGSEVLRSAIEARLNSGTNVVLQTTGTAGDGVGNGDINIFANIVQSGGFDTSLTLNAHNDINIEADIGSTAGKLDMNFNADSDNSGDGQVNLIAQDSTTTLDANGGTINAQNETVNVIVGGGGVVKLDSDLTANNLNISFSNPPSDSGQLDGSGNIIVNGGFNWTGADISGTGKLITKGPSTTSAIGQIIQKTWINTGSIVIGGTADITVGGPSFDMNGGSLVIKNGGLMSMDDSAFNMNAGSLVIEAGATLDSNNDFNMNGGAFDLAAGGDINYNTFNWTAGTLKGGGSLGGSGFNFTGSGNRILNGPSLTVPRLNLLGGSLHVLGGTFNVQGFSGPGPIFVVEDSKIGSGAGLFLNGGTTTIGSLLINDGTFNVNTAVTLGSFENNGASSLTNGSITTTGAFTNNGTFVLTNGLVTSGGLLTNNGLFSGNGTIGVGSNIFLNNGTLSPGHSPGRFDINGNLVLGPTSIINIELGGLQQGVSYDLINVSGTAALDGTLNIALFGNFLPLLGTNFDVINYSSATGSFAQVNSPSIFPFTTSNFGSFFRLTSQGVRFPPGTNPIDAILAMGGDRPPSVPPLTTQVAGIGISGEESIRIIGFQQCP